MNDWIWTLPFLCGFLWAAGGRPKGRYFRRIGVGLVISLYSYAYTGTASVFTCVATYWIVTAIGYGKYIAKRFWLGVFVIGIFYGCASAPVAIIYRSPFIIAQALVAAGTFTGLTYWSNTGTRRLHWALVEGFTGIGATILIPAMIIG